MTVQHRPFARTPTLVAVLVAWSLLAVLTAALNPPSWLGLPIVGTFNVSAVGFAVVLVAGIRDVPIALAVIVSAGFASLILSSELFLIADRLHPFATVGLQAALVCALCAWALQRHRADCSTQTPGGEAE